LGVQTRLKRKNKAKQVKAGNNEKEDESVIEDEEADEEVEVDLYELVAGKANKEKNNEQAQDEHTEKTIVSQKPGDNEQEAISEPTNK
jgi:hypothetical protein